MRMVIYRRGEEIYAYSYKPYKWFEAMECCMSHGLNEDLSLTLNEAGSVCKAMENGNGDTAT